MRIIQPPPKLDQNTKSNGIIGPTINLTNWVSPPSQGKAHPTKIWPKNNWNWELRIIGKKRPKKGEKFLKPRNNQ